MSQENKFSVYVTCHVDKEDEYVHWSKGLTMHIQKDSVRIELTSEEIQQLVKSLPATVGGSY